MTDAAATPDLGGIGSEADQLARLSHAEEVHGLMPHDCPACDGDEPCDACDGWGVVFTLPKGQTLAPCGPDCPLLDARPV